MIVIPKPCTQNWSSLIGSDQKKYCALCQKNIYNLNKQSDEAIRHVLTVEKKVCGMIQKEYNHSSVKDKLKYWIWGVGLLVVPVFGQHDSLTIRGIINDGNGIPVMDSHIALKGHAIETFSNENGEFQLKVPNDLKTYILVAKDNEYQTEIQFKEEELSKVVRIPLQQHEEFIIGEVIYKPTFKQRVIHTITWPYRKIRKTFFDNQ